MISDDGDERATVGPNPTPQRQEIKQKMYTPRDHIDKKMLYNKMASKKTSPGCRLVERHV